MGPNEPGSIDVVRLGGFGQMDLTKGLFSTSTGNEILSGTPQMSLGTLWGSRLEMLLYSLHLVISQALSNLTNFVGIHSHIYCTQFVSLDPL
jgi:hypothetical protein